jgi:hypothetical protein
VAFILVLAFLYNVWYKYIQEDHLVFDTQLNFGTRRTIKEAKAMNTYLKMLLIGAASVSFASAAYADTCQLAGSANPVTQADLGLTGPSTPTQIVAALKQTASYPAKDCPATELETSIVSSNNGWKADTPVPMDYRFSIPLIAAAPSATPAAAAAPQVTAATVQPAPVAAPAAKTVVERQPIYTTKVVQAGLSAADKQHLSDLTAEDTRLQMEIDRINLLPNPTPEQLELLAALTDQKSGIQQQILSLSGRVNTLTNEVSGMWTWLYGIIALMVLGLGLLAWRKPSRKALAEVMPDMSGYVTVEAFEERLDGIESRFKHVVKRTTSTHLPQSMKAMADGSKFTYILEIDGGLVSFGAEKVSTTPSGDGLIKVDVLARPVTAKMLFGALADYVENGGTLPTTLKAVNA